LELPRRDALAIDWGIGAVVIGIGGLLGLLAATVPAAWAARVSLSSLLANSAVRGGGGRRRLRRSIIVAQVALSVVLLSSGGLVVRSFERLLRADPGFKPEGLFSVRVRTPPEYFPGPADASGFRVPPGTPATPSGTQSSSTSSARAPATSR
ncbi:MAG: hypothetical protein ACRD2A_02060, partial [Vicinamibacterales bacterium]